MLLAWPWLCTSSRMDRPGHHQSRSTCRTKRIAPVKWHEMERFHDNGNENRKGLIQRLNNPNQIEPAAAAI
ncbi:hypothetical protein ABLN68_03930, partial [Mycobacterium tuberculosis]